MATRDRMDPELLAGLDAFIEASGPRGLAGIVDVGERRLKFAEMMAAAAEGAGPADQRVTSENRSVPGGPGAPDVSVRVYRPNTVGGSALPGLLYIHGGGFVIGSIGTEDAIARMVAVEVGCVVVSVDYRLAPEHQHPAQVEDCYAALCWLAAEASALGVDRSRLAVYGGSAGGNLAAATAIVARDRGGPALAYQMLLYPMLDDRCATPSIGEIDDVGIWDGWAHRDAWAALLGERADRDGVPASAAPARAADLSDLPPAFVDVGELDSLRDEDVEYAQRLLQAGVQSELHVYPGAYHGWEIFAPDAEVSRRAVRVRIDALRRALRTSQPFPT